MELWDTADEWTVRLRERVLNTPPTCLAGLRAVPVKQEKWSGFALWSFVCACGGTKGKLLGYRLEDIDPDCGSSQITMSPLAFECSSCRKITEVFNSELHGYDAQFGWVRRNVGTGSRKASVCNACNETTFAIVGSFAHAHFDHIDDDPELAPRAQDYFDGFACSGTCAACGKERWLAEFELA